MRCAVVGAGAWGTALADLLARNAHDVVLWAYERDVVEAVNARHANPRFLPGAAIDPSVRATCSLGDATAGAELVVYVTPSHVLRTVLKGDRHAVAADATLVVATKGIERGSLVVMTDVVKDELPGRPVVALSGPSFAAEVIARQPTAVVAASTSDAAAQLAQRAFSSETFRVYSHDDVVGVEVGGALKNVIAVAAGILEGLGLGHNPRAALITRGLAEITRLGAAMGADPLTFAGLAGMGDLVLTATGSLSRNRALGIAIGRGRTLEQYRAEHRSVAEGANASKAGAALGARLGVELPIIEKICDVLFDGKPAGDAVAELMTRELKSEQWK
jgi:glycerol-3-phosphate dehydrogenase (NAD(P)+)